MRSQTTCSVSLFSSVYILLSGAGLSEVDCNRKLPLQTESIVHVMLHSAVIVIICGFHQQYRELLLYNRLPRQPLSEPKKWGSKMVAMVKWGSKMVAMVTYYISIHYSNDFC